MGKRVPKGWVYNSDTSDYEFQVYNASGTVKTIFNEDADLFHGGTKLTATAAQLNFVAGVTSAVQTQLTERVTAASVLFTEAGAGTYTGAINLPAGAVIQDIIVHAIALWAAATSAAMIVGDAADDNGFYDAVDLKATDLLAGESLSFAFAGGKQGADVDVVATGFHIRRRYLAGARVVSGKITSVGAGTTGRTLMTVIYAVPVTTAAVKS